MSKRLNAGAHPFALAGRQGGGSLMTVLMGLALVGILGAITVPTYASYTRRVYISEGLELAMPVKAAATEYYEMEKHRASATRTPVMVKSVPFEFIEKEIEPLIQPETMATQGSKGVEAVLRAGSLVMVSYATSVDPKGKTNYYLVLRPGASAGGTAWSCLSGDAAEGTVRTARVDMGARRPMPESLAAAACKP